MMQRNIDSYSTKASKPDDASNVDEETDVSDSMTTSTSSNDQKAGPSSGPSYFDLGQASTDMIRKDQFKMDLLTKTWDSSKFVFPIR